MKRKGLYQLIEAGDYYRDEDYHDPKGKGEYKPVPKNWIGTPTEVHCCPIFCT